MLPKIVFLYLRSNGFGGGYVTNQWGFLYDNFSCERIAIMLDDAFDQVQLRILF